MSNTKISSEQIIDGVALGGNPTTTTQSAGNNTTRVATTAFVTTAVANLVDSAPSSLDTLNELAAAMNDNASFFSTVLPLSGGTMTGDLVLGDNVILEIGAGTGGDLRIFHDGTNSAIQNTTGDLFIYGGTNEIRLRAKDDEESIVVFPNGKVELYFNNSVKLETFSGGIDVSGVIYNGGGTAQAVGIGASMGDVNAVELGAGYLSLARDDTADAKQILFEKNDVEHSSITTKASSLDIASAQAIVLDSAGDITLDADGGDIRFKDAGTEIAVFENSSSNLQIKVSVQDKDIIFRGNDGGSGINALTLDMSEAGHATFNAGATFSGNVIFDGSANLTSNTSDGSDNAQIVIAGGGSTVSADTRGASIHLAGNENGNGGLLQLRAGSGSVGGIRLYSGGSERLRVTDNGITFNADTAAANALDDYEEGTWTPSFTGSGYSFGTHTGSYIKVGRLCTVTGNLVINGVGTNTSSVFFSGLPFTAHNVSGQFQQGIAREATATGRIYSVQVNVNTTAGGVNSMDGVASGSNEIFTTGQYGFTVTYLTG